MVMHTHSAFSGWLKLYNDNALALLFSLCFVYHIIHIYIYIEIYVCFEEGSVLDQLVETLKYNQKTIQTKLQPDNIMWFYFFFAKWNRPKLNREREREQCSRTENKNHMPNYIFASEFLMAFIDFWRIMEWSDASMNSHIDYSRIEYRCCCCFFFFFVFILKMSWWNSSSELTNEQKWTRLKACFIELNLVVKNSTCLPHV